MLAKHPRLFPTIGPPRQLSALHSPRLKPKTVRMYVFEQRQQQQQHCYVTTLYLAVYPPSMTMLAPVVYELASLAR